MFCTSVKYLHSRRGVLSLHVSKKHAVRKAMKWTKHAIKNEPGNGDIVPIRSPFKQRFTFSELFLCYAVDKLKLSKTTVPTGKQRQLRGNKGRRNKWMQKKASCLPYYDEALAMERTSDCKPNSVEELVWKMCLTTCVMSVKNCPNSTIPQTASPPGADQRDTNSLNWESSNSGYTNIQF